MGLVARKSVFRVSGEVILKQACSAIETSQKIEISPVASLDFHTFQKANTKGTN